MNRSWQLSFPQLAATAAAVIVVVSMFTVVSLRGFSFAGGSGSGVSTSGLALPVSGLSVKDRFRQQQEVIAYWNERVELNKAL
jgi:hypothetical protein